MAVSQDEPAAPSPDPWRALVGRALVVGASGGLGAALAARLRGAGEEEPIRHALLFEVRALSRRAPDVRDRIDLTDEASIAAACATLGAEPVDGAPLRLAIVAAGLLHDGGVYKDRRMENVLSRRRRFARSTRRRSPLIPAPSMIAVNAIGPALVAKHVLPLLPREGRGVFAVLSARVGSIGDNRLRLVLVGGWYGYRASKAALNQIVRTLAIEVRRSRPDAIVVALHPGTVAIRAQRAVPGRRARGRAVHPRRGGRPPAARHRPAKAGRQRRLLRLGRRADPVLTLARALKRKRKPGRQDHHPGHSLNIISYLWRTGFDQSALRRGGA